MRKLLLKSFRIGQKNNKANYYLPTVFGTCANLWNILLKLYRLSGNNPGSSSQNQIINFQQVICSLFFTFWTNRDLSQTEFLWSPFPHRMRVVRIHFEVSACEIRGRLGSPRRPYPATATVHLPWNHVWNCLPQTVLGAEQWLYPWSLIH